MAPKSLLWLLTTFILQTWAAPQATTSASNAVPTACGDLIRAATIDNPYGIVRASQVYDCWATVPFNAAVATRFVRYWNDTLQFQSSLDWLKNPPSSYQKPAADLIAGIQQLQKNIDSGGFNGEYEFESALQRLLYSANDNHVSLYAGLLSSFTFASPLGLTTLSLDGVALPKVYITDDLYWNETRTPEDTWQPSAVSQINGQDAVEYLSEFAALNSRGTLAPHADWNTLMDSPVLDILLYFTEWQGDATFYPGNNISFTFENGSTSANEWYAVYNDPGDTGPLETGGDFYNFFVLGLYPASYNVNASVASNETSYTAPPASSWAAYSSAYPDDPVVVQDNLANTGYITGYFLRESSTAVLSVPSFFADDGDIQAFSNAVQNFLTQSKSQGMQKVVVDLQGNHGGDILLAYNTFKQFFPAIEPFAGSKRRAHPLANTMGDTITTYWNNLSTTDDQYANFSSDEWIAITRLNANTGQNFSSWAEIYGPVFDGVGNFMLSERLNTSSYIFDYSAFGEVDPPAPLLQSGGANPYAASDIIMLSDSLCSSSCALFMEMMRYDAGVKTVVVGGRPRYGPMQAPGQSRAARFYSLYSLEVDIHNTRLIDPTAVLPNRQDDLSIYTLGGGISLREQVRPNDPEPLSMKFEAADCRIFWTPGSWNNFTNLWQYAADAIWTDTSKCVQDSTGYASTPNSSSSYPLSSVPAGVKYDSNGILSFGNAMQNIPLINTGEPAPDAPIPIPKPVRPSPYIQQYSNPQGPNGGQKTYQTTANGGNRNAYRAECVFSSNRPAPYCPRKRKRGLDRLR